MNNPLVSAIVPAYNAEDTVAECVHSILSQNYPNIEVIVVDDGSVDHTSSIIEKLKKRDSRLRLIRQRNAGVSAARNSGIVASQGEWVTFVDADDRLPDNSISTLLSVALKMSVPIVAGAVSFDSVKNNGDILLGPVRAYGSTCMLVDVHDEFEELFTANCVQSACSKLIKKSMLVDYRILFDEALSSFEDFAFVLDCLEVSSCMAVVPSVCYHYLRRSVGTGSTSYKSDIVTQMERLSNKVVSFYADVLGHPWSDDCLCHIAQFFVVAVNNIQKSILDWADVRTQMELLVDLPVFSKMLNEAKCYPNAYSRLVCQMALTRRWHIVAALATLRNSIRSRHVAK